MPRLAVVRGTGLSDTLSFPLIPQAFTELECTLIGRATGGSGAVAAQLVLNGDVAAHYDVLLQGANAGGYLIDNRVAQNNMVLAFVAAAAAGANVICASKFWLPGYAAGTFFKQVLCLTGNVGGGFDASKTVTGLWLSTAAITQLDLVVSSGNWTSDSVLYVWGRM